MLKFNNNTMENQYALVNGRIHEIGGENYINNLFNNRSKDGSVVFIARGHFNKKMMGTNYN